MAFSPLNHGPLSEDALRLANGAGNVAGYDACSGIDHEVVARLIARLFELGLTEPQKLIDAAALLSTSKLFIAMVS